MEEQREEAEKWQGTATAELKGIQSDQIWPLLSDFCNVHKWLPHLDTCYPADVGEGVDVDVEPGVIRYCASASFPTAGDGAAAAEEVKYSKERLLSIDHQDRWLSYDILENNAGFGAYVATLRLVDAAEGEGCVIEWSYVADPVLGWAPQELLSFIQLALHSMAARMEEFVAQPQPQPSLN